MRKRKSPILEAVHQTARGLHKAGVMDQVTLRGFASVWDAIEETPQQAASLRARAELLMALQAWVKLNGKTQAEAAQIFGMTQPRVSDLMRGKINLFSLSTLMDMATAAGLEPRITIKKPRKRAGELAAA